MTHFGKIMMFSILLLLGNMLDAQSNEVVSVDLLQTPDEFTMINVSDLVRDPATAPIIFQIRISPLVQDPEISAEVEFTADIPELNLRNTRLFLLRTEPFVLPGPITLTNRNLAQRTNVLMTEQGESITLFAGELELLSGPDREALINEVLSAPTFPAGTYTFRYEIFSESSPEMVPVEDVITIQFDAPPGIRLLSPVDESVIQTTYPVFQWESTGETRNCHYGIRVAEYLQSRHGSFEEALHDDAVLPFPDNGGYEELTEATSFQYPLTEAKELEKGNQYVWQVLKYCTSPRGEEIIESEIYSFSVGGEEINPVILALQSILGEDRYEALFNAGGALAGFSADPGDIILDGNIISMSELMDIAAQFNSGQYEVIQSQVTDQ